MPVKINGSSSGSVTLEAPASGSDVTLTLPDGTGTSGQLLSTNGSGALSFVNGGKILQVVRATDSTQRTTTSTSMVDASISVTITPQKSDSNILLIWNARVSSANNGYTDIRIADSSNNAISGAEFAACGDGTSTEQTVTVTAIGWASPNTTNATTFKGRFATNTGTGSLRNNTQTGQLFAIEVAA